jgi:hypothetical protein
MFPQRFTDDGFNDLLQRPAVAGILQHAMNVVQIDHGMRTVLCAGERQQSCPFFSSDLLNASRLLQSATASQLLRQLFDKPLQSSAAEQMFECCGHINAFIVAESSINDENDAGR